MVLEAALKVIEPRPAVRLIDWALENGWNEDGKPFNDFAYPHLSAPGGPFDAFDCPQYFDIWLQWASRLSKTFGGQIAMMKTADCDPCPMMFAAPDEKLATEIIERDYAMIESCRPLAALLPPPNRRKQSRISLRFSRVYVAWARSVSTLADKSARFIHDAEIDKWEHQKTSKEADPLKLSDDRAKDFPTFKRWKESTPAKRQTSRIERGRLGSCNASLWVECPLCGRFQILKMARLVWDKTEAGKSDKDLATTTARYLCLHCERELRDEHRGPMMRSGVWIPEGCGCDDDKAREVLEYWRQPGREAWGGWRDSPWITGTPLRDGRDYGSHLSSLYALARSWGSVASEWVSCQKNPQNLRNFINGWLAETWELATRQATWEQIGDRLIDLDIRCGVVPAWASMVTIGVDKQEDSRYPWVADAWGPERRSATIGYGQATSLAELAEVIKREWPHADKRTPVKASVSLIDSGNRPADVYEFVCLMQQSGNNVLACKGSSTELNADWRRSTLSKDSSLPGMEIFLVDTIRSQLWIDRTVHVLNTKEAGGTSLYAGSLQEHEDFLQQLINDAAVESLDKRNNARESWERIDSNIPNDYRDCKRYGYTGMLIVTRGGPIHQRHAPAPQIVEEAPRRIRELKIRGR